MLGNRNGENDVSLCYGPKAKPKKKKKKKS